MKKLADWFTDARRQALHAALGTLAAFAVAAGWVNDEQSATLIGLTGSGLVLLQGVISLFLLRPSEAARWFGTVGRGLVFGLAASAGAAGVAFGLIGNDEVTHWLGLISVALTALSAFLAVVNVQTVPDTVPLPVPAKATRSDLRDYREGRMSEEEWRTRYGAGPNAPGGTDPS